MVRHQFRLSLVPGRPSVSLPEHLAIIEAVCARDPERAEHAMWAHLTSVLEALRAFATPSTSRGGGLERRGRPAVRSIIRIR